LVKLYIEIINILIFKNGGVLWKKFI